ncbi:MAG: CDP-alcohol phosphatidyltransferase family protein [Bacteroidales bacterium]
MTKGVQHNSYGRGRSFQRHIPNGLTIMNVLSGMTAILLASQGQIALSGLFFLICLIFDFADGFAAKLLKAGSELGKQLDSLADVVSFGVYPAMAAFFILRHLPLDVAAGLLAYSVILFPAAAVVRLAIFNTEEQHSNYFKGLPVPAAAVGLITIAFVVESVDQQNLSSTIYGSPYFIMGLLVLYSILMVSKLPMLSFKFVTFSWQENRHRIIFTALAFGLIVWFKIPGLPLLIPLYILYSLLFIRKQAN